MKTHINRSSILLSLLTVLLIGGCSGEDGKDGKDCTLPVSDDTTPPTVLSVTPADGGNEVDERTILTVTFDEAMDKESMNSATFRLVQGSTLLPGTVESSGSSAVFKPALPLEQGALYSAAITTDAQDLAGNPLQTAYNWSFTTQSEEDLTPPTVVLTDPQDGHKVPYLTAQVSAYFSEEMDAATINTDTFTLENPRGKVAGSVSYSANKATLNITDQRLDLNSRYSAAITDFVKDSNGLRMAQEHQWEFITLDGSWQEATLIESNTGSAGSPQIAADGNGNAMAVWYQYDGSQLKIYANRFDARSGSWQGTALIESGTGDAFPPQIAVDGNGSAIAVWYQYDGSQLKIYANRFDVRTGSWQGTALIKNDDIYSAYAPQIAMDDSGNAIAVWYQSSGTYTNIYANRFDARSGSWQGAALIEGGTGDARYPQIAVDDSGNAIALWYQNDGSHDSIYANRFDARSGIWQGVTLIESGAGNAYTPQIAIDGSGNAIALWYQYDGSHDSIYTNRFDAHSGSWQGETLIESSTESAGYPQIAVDGSGNAMAVWRQYNGSKYDIHANYFDARSGSWQGAALIESDTGDTFKPQITVDGNGNAIALWYQYDGSHDSVYANRFDAHSGSWQGATLIESGTSSAGYPQITVADSGNCMAIWIQYDGSYYSVYTNRFE